MDKAIEALNKIIGRDAVMMEVRGYGILEKEEVEIIMEALNKSVDVAALTCNIIQHVCELPDRTSPDDKPDMCLVSVQELDLILKEHLQNNVLAGGGGVDKTKYNTTYQKGYRSGRKYMVDQVEELTIKVKIFTEIIEDNKDHKPLVYALEFYAVRANYPDWSMEKHNKGEAKGPPVQVARKALKQYESQDISGWLDIESAPMLTCVLVSYPISGKPNAVVTAVHTVDGWRGFAVSSNDIKLHNEYTPTHWQPLPLAPKQGGK